MFPNGGSPPKVHSSRAYYAAFYAIEAVLLTNNGLFRERQLGDYEFDLSIGEDEANEDIKSAISILCCLSL